MFVVRPVAIHFAWWLILAPLLLIELRAFHALQETIALQDSSRARHAIAQVTDSVDRAHGADIRYQFQVPGDPTWYSAADAIGRRNLWMSVSDAAIETARQREGRIEVSYLPENPWANQPSGQAGNPVADGAGGWLLFLLLDVVWLGETFLLARNYLRCLLAAERQQPCHVRFWRTRRV